MPAAQPQRSYTRDEVCRLLQIRKTVLEQWEDFRFVPRQSEYAFRDLIALQTLRRLRRSRVRPARIRLILESLRKKLGNGKDPLTEIKVSVDGRRIAVQIDGRKMEPLSGQLLLDFDQQEIRRLLEFPGGRARQEKSSEDAAQKIEADRWFEKGIKLEHSGGPVDETLAAYRRAIEIDPHAAGALLNLGAMHYRLNQTAEAERCYLRAIESRPGYALAHYNLAILYDETGNWAAALEQYEKALTLDPQYADAHYNIALLYQNQGDTLKAVRHWRQYLKLDPQGYWAGIARRELSQLRRATIIDGTGG